MNDDTETSAQFDLEVIDSANRRLRDESIPAVVVPAATTTINMERFASTPRRMRSKFATSTLADLIAYVAHHLADGGEQTEVVAIHPDGNVTAILDYCSTEGVPGWAEHIACHAPRLSPAYDAAIRLRNNSPVDQRQIINWLEDWADLIKPSSDGDEMSVPQAIAALRKLTIDTARTATVETGALRNVTSAMERVEASSSAGKPPTRFTFTGPVWEGLADRTVVLSMQISTGGDKLGFSLRIVGLDLLIQSLRDEIQTVITAGLPLTPIVRGVITVHQPTA